MDQKSIIGKLDGVELIDYPFQHFVSESFLDLELTYKIQNELLDLEKLNLVINLSHSLGLRKNGRYFLTL